MAPVSNRFAKYIIQQDDAGGGGSAPAPKQNRFAKYKAVEAPAVQQINPMVAQGRVAQQEWQAAGAKPANPNPENPIVTAQRSSQTQAMSQWAQQREAERQAEAARTKARRESAAAFGGGMDMLPTEDEAGNVRPGTAVDTDISKGVVGAPFQALEAVKDAGVSMANLGGETYNAVNNALTAPFGVKPMQVPKITTPDNPLIGEGGPLQSVTGDLGRNLMQFLIARKIVGNIAPGGGTAAQLGKDAVALGAGFDADTARLSETVNEFVQKSGSPQIAKDYIGWLAERNPSNPLLERFKNMVEDLTISGPLVAPQAVARGAQAVGNAIAPVARTPTNAGGTAARAAVADPFLVRDPAPAPSPVAAPAASAAPQAPVTSVPATRAAPQPPAPPVAPSANAAPPPGTLTPVPNANAATAEFNALPRKVRESVFRAMRNSGFDNNGIIAAIRDLNTLPPERQSMFATELVRKYGAQFPELEANLAAMGRKFAVDTPKPRQIFGRTIERDGARQVMNDEVRSQIDSEADYLNQTVERLFGPGAVPAKEELLRLQQAGGAEYRRLLSTTNRYGRARAPAKRAEIDRNIATLASYLKRPEVMNNVPDWVKQKVMLEVSNDLRQLKFTPDEQAIIVAGDPGLAALFTPDAPLTYSPQLWNTLVDLYPTQSAHSLQSAYAKAIREARFSSDPQTRVWVDTLSRARGKSTVRANARNADDRGFGLLKMLEDAVPGYKEARMKYGNVMGAQEALDDARQFMSIAGDETKLAQFIDDYEDLSDLQRTAVENQVSSIIRQSIANKVDNPKLAELGREGPSTPNLTAISKQPFLDALPKVFGARGQEMADAIRLARSNTDYLTGLHPKYNSRTGVNEADVKNADRIYEDPAGAESSIIDNAVTQGLGGAGLGAAFIPGAAGAALPLIGLAAAKALWTARKAGKRLSPSEKTQLAEFLFRSRRQAATGADGAAAPGGPPQLPGPRGPSPLDTGGNMAAGAAIGAAVGGAASGGDPNAMIAGATTGAGAGAVRAQARNAASLIKPTRAPNALASPPARPPAKAGTDGTKLNGMGGTPEGIGAATGATAGYLANPTDANGDGVIDDQDRGLNAMGGLVSGGLGVKAVRSGANAARNAMIPQARVMAEAATPVGISAIRKSSFTAKDGTSYSVDFEKVKGGGVEVTFHPESGPRATTSAMQDEYAPLANGTLSDAVEVFRNVEKAIKDDIATKGEARYILQGRTKRQRDLYSQFARTRKAPDGYSWKVEQRPGERDLLTLVREGNAPAKRPPPAQAGFGGSSGQGGKGPPNALAPKKPNSEMRGSLGRAAAGGVIGGAVGSTADAEAQDYGAQLQAVSDRIAELEADQMFFRDATAEQIQERLTKEGFDLGKYGADGKIGRDTAAAIKGLKAQIEQDLTDNRARRKELENQIAFEKTRPNDAQQILREAAPYLGAAAGIFFGGRSRMGAVKKAAVGAQADIARANSLLTPGPINTSRNALARAAVKGQPANINEFWRMGGAGENVPFDVNTKGDWRSRPKATPPSKLFPEKTPRLRAGDYAVIASALGEAGISTVGIEMVQKELEAAQAEAAKNPTEANLQRVEQARDMLGVLTAAQRLGLFFAGGRALSAWKKPYQSARPNIAEAEAERARLLEYFQRLKK